MRCDFRISVDDGHEDDLRIFEMLKDYGLLDIATFYIAPKNRQRPVMRRSDIIRISKEVEIGGHTMTHPWLTDLPKYEQINEIITGKNELEEMIGRKLKKFAYPRGYNNQEVRESVKECGFEEGRTMKQGRVARPDMTVGYDPFELPVTVHTHPDHIGNWRQLFEQATNKEDGYFHVTMHGWEISKFDLWEELNKIFYEIKSARERQK